MTKTTKKLHQELIDLKVDYLKKELEIKQLYGIPLYKQIRECEEINDNKDIDRKYSCAHILCEADSEILLDYTYIGSNGKIEKDSNESVTFNLTNRYGTCESISIPYEMFDDFETYIKKEIEDHKENMRAANEKLLKMQQDSKREMYEELKKEFG